MIQSWSGAEGEETFSTETVGLNGNHDLYGGFKKKWYDHWIFSSEQVYSCKTHIVKLVFCGDHKFGTECNIRMNYIIKYLHVALNFQQVK